MLMPTVEKQLPARDSHNKYCVTTLVAYIRFFSGVLAVWDLRWNGSYPTDLRRIYEGICRGAAVGGAVHRADRRVPGARSAQGGGGRPLGLLEGMAKVLTRRHVER